MLPEPATRVADFAFSSTRHSFNHLTTQHTGSIQSQRYRELHISCPTWAQIQYDIYSIPAIRNQQPRSSSPTCKASTSPKKRTQRPIHNQIIMPPRKSTSSVTPAETDEPSQISPQAQSTADKPITATEQQIKARAELGVSVDVSRRIPLSRVSNWKREGNETFASLKPAD